jgi:hypothetical protein
MHQPKIKEGTVMCDITPCSVDSLPMFWRNISPPSSELNKESKTAVWKRVESQSWRRWYVPLKRQLAFNGPHGVISQTTTAARTKSPEELRNYTRKMDRLKAQHDPQWYTCLNPNSKLQSVSMLLTYFVISPKNKICFIVRCTTETEKENSSWGLKTTKQEVLGRTYDLLSFKCFTLFDKVCRKHKLLLLLLLLLLWPPLWSSGQSSWLQIRRPGFDSRHYQKKKKVAGLEQGPLSLVSTTEELLDRKVAAPV